MLKLSQQTQHIQEIKQLICMSEYNHCLVILGIKKWENKMHGNPTSHIWPWKI